MVSLDDIVTVLQKDACLEQVRGPELLQRMLCRTLCRQDVLVLTRSTVNELPFDFSECYSIRLRDEAVGS